MSLSDSQKTASDLLLWLQEQLFINGEVTVESRADDTGRVVFVTISRKRRDPITIVVSGSEILLETTKRFVRTLRVVRGGKQP